MQRGVPKTGRMNRQMRHEVCMRIRGLILSAGNLVEQLLLLCYWNPGELLSPFHVLLEPR